MADAALTVKSYLIIDSTLIAMLGPMSVKAGGLPPAFDPATGPVVVVALHTGHLHEESPALALEFMRITVWAGANQFLEAWNAYARIQKLLASVNMINVSPYGFIVRSTEMSHTPMTDSETGWATITGIYGMEIHD